MTQRFQELAGLDRLIHEPARLALMIALQSCRTADFVFLHRLTGLTSGNLSSHLGKLEAAGLVTIDKGYRGKVPQTRVSLTDAGRIAIEQHWRTLDVARTSVADMSPEQPIS